MPDVHVFEWPTASRCRDWHAIRIPSSTWVSFMLLSDTFAIFDAVMAARFVSRHEHSGHSVLLGTSSPPGRFAQWLKSTNSIQQHRSKEGFSCLFHMTMILSLFNSLFCLLQPSMSHAQQACDTRHQTKYMLTSASFQSSTFTTDTPLRILHYQCLTICYCHRTLPQS